MSETEKTKKTQNPDKKGFDYIRSGMDEYPFVIRIIDNVVIFLVWVFFKIFYPWKFKNLDSMLSELKMHGCVVIQNHVSMVEPVVMVVELWRHGIHTRPIYKVEFEKIGPAKWLFRHVGGIPVDRGKADMRCIRAAKDALARGECVLIYPEGTRIKSDDQKIEFNGGFAMIAQMAKAPVIPCAVVGAADPYKKRKTLRRKPIVIASDALIFDDMPGESRKDIQEAMERIGMEKLYALRDQLRQDNPTLW